MKASTPAKPAQSDKKPTRGWSPVTILLLIVFLSCLVSSASALAADPPAPETKMILTIGSTRYSLIDPHTGQPQAKECDTRPVIKDGRTMVPVRVISEGLGFGVLWDALTRTVTITSLTRTARHVVGTNALQITIAGQAAANVVLDVRSYINEDGRTMLPVRGIVEALGCKVDWNPIAREVLINFTDAETRARMTAILPNKFDTRDYVKVTSVKEQGGTGGCWAFTSIAALETHLAVSEGHLLDLSENNLMTQLSGVYDESYSRNAGDGGDDLMAVGYYAAWRGPALEVDDPFPGSKQPEDMVLRTGQDPACYVQEVLFLPERRGPLDNDHIKRAVIQYGAVSAAMWKGSPQTFGPYYNDDAFAWYYDQAVMNKEGHGHAVTIVGWDDEFSKSHFKITPPGDGAFIVRDSKGPLWGHSQGKKNIGGYFYVSYYDLMFMTKLDSLIGNHVFSRVSDVRPYDRIYQHDVLGFNYPMKLNANSNANQPTAVSFANVFKTANPHGEMLKAVSFYALEENVDYTVSVVAGFSGPDSLKSGIRVARGRFSLPGYHTVELPEPISLPADSRFAVIVTQSADGAPAIATDSTQGHWVQKSASEQGESYIWNGEWVDLYSVQPNTSVCLKAFTDDKSVPAEDMMSVSQMKEELDWILDRFLAMHATAKEAGFTREQKEIIRSVRWELARPLSREDYYFQVLRVFAMMGDGHTNIHSPFSERLYLDVPFKWLMDDGLVVSRSTKTLRKGDRIRSIGGASEEELVRLLAPIVPHENDYWIRANAPDILRRGSCISFLGLPNSDGSVDVEVLRDGKTVVFRIYMSESYTRVDEPFVAMEWRMEKANDLGYFRFDRFPSRDEKAPLAEEIARFFTAVRENGISNVVFDWRYNPGGYTVILGDILSYIRECPSRLPDYGFIDRKPEAQLFDGQLYILNSNGTFSASVVSTTILRDNRFAMTVGEPTGENPDFNRGGSLGGGDLPNTGWHFTLCTGKSDRPKPNLSEIAVFPDIPVHTSWADLLAGRDIQLERLREITAGRGWRYASQAITLPQGTASVLTVALGDRDSFDDHQKVVYLSQKEYLAGHVYFIDTETHGKVHDAYIQDSKLQVPATLEPGVTYHLVFEAPSGSVAFLFTIWPDDGAYGSSQMAIQSFYYVSRWRYFCILFPEPIKSYRAQGITVVDSDGKHYPLRSVEIAANHDNILLVCLSEPVVQSKPVVVTLPINAVQLSGGATNTTTLKLSNYMYY